MYKFEDSTTGTRMTADDYDSLSELAGSEIDEKRYYDLSWKVLEREGLRSLVRAGRILTPDNLRTHPDYISFFDGKSYTPAVYLKVADIFPGNPMGSFNPDVAIFMHRLRIIQQTAVMSWLELKHVIRGPQNHHIIADALGYQIVWNRLSALPTKYWLNDLSEVYKWPVFPDLERLGYSPSTIQLELVVYDRARSLSTYSMTKRSRLISLIKAARQYMMQFDTPSGGEFFNSYSLMLAPIDRRVQPWYQAPLFESFDSTRQVFQTKTYDFHGYAFPELDRIRYSTVSDNAGRSVLIPTAIVRPIRVYPTVHFRTVFTIPESIRSEGSIVLFYLKAQQIRLVADPELSRTRKRFGPFSTLFGEPRPYGHPLNYISSRSLDRAGNLGLRDTNSPDYVPVESRQVAESALSKQPKADSPNLALAYSQHQIPGTPEWLPLDEDTPSDHSSSGMSFTTQRKVVGESSDTGQGLSMGERPLQSGHFEASSVDGESAVQTSRTGSRRTVRPVQTTKQVKSYRHPDAPSEPLQVDDQNLGHVRQRLRYEPAKQRKPMVAEDKLVQPRPQTALEALEEHLEPQLDTWLYKDIRTPEK